MLVGQVNPELLLIPTSLGLTMILTPAWDCAALCLKPTCWSFVYRWVFLIKKSYQDIDTSLQSAVVTKVKGVAYTNNTMLGERLWDVADFVIPSQVRSLPGSWASEVGRVT